MDSYPILKHMLYSRKLYELLFSNLPSDVEIGGRRSISSAF